MKRSAPLASGMDSSTITLKEEIACYNSFAFYSSGRIRMIVIFIAEG